MSVLQRFTVEYLLNTKDELLDSNLFDIIAKFMYQGVYRGVPYNIDLTVTSPLISSVTFDPIINSNSTLLKAFYPDYTWVAKKIVGREIALGRNSQKKFLSIDIMPFDYAYMKRTKNPQELHRKIDDVFESLQTLNPVDAFDFFEKIEQLN